MPATKRDTTELTRGSVLVTPLLFAEKLEVSGLTHLYDLALTPQMLRVAITNCIPTWPVAERRHRGPSVSGRSQQWFPTRESSREKGSQQRPPVTGGPTRGEVYHAGPCYVDYRSMEIGIVGVPRMYGAENERRI
jgi:hypothetical protein